MAQLNDFSKIIHNGNEIGKVLHKNSLVWSSGFDGDFSKPELWEMGSINSSGSPYSSQFPEARTKDFYKVPERGMVALNISYVQSKDYSADVYFYQDEIHSTYISQTYIQKQFPSVIPVPNNAEYYKLVLYNGIGAQRYAMSLPEAAIEANIQLLPENIGVYLAQDSDFVKVDGYWVYRGKALEVEIPTHINGELVTSTAYMFSGVMNFEATPVTKVVLLHSNVTNMTDMFRSSEATTLDLSIFNTSNVTNMYQMFRNSSSTTLDLSSFNTSNVTNMNQMFQNSKVTILDLSSFNTIKVTNMYGMFRGYSATTLDLSSFNTIKVTDMRNMFQDSSATIGYARTQADANKFNATAYKPTGLTFVVKP